MEPYLEAWAERAVKACQESLPPPLREVALRVPVVFADRPDDPLLAADTLGLFVGDAVDMDAGADPTLTRIELYLGNLWKFVERSPRDYLEEVRITYLHELGHLFGWDEDDVSIRGLE